MPRLITVLLTLGLFAVACNGASGNATTTTSGATSTTAAAETIPSAVDTTTTAAPAAGGDAECLVGTWVLDSEAFIAEMEEIFRGAGMPDADIAPLDGDFTVTLSEDGALSAIREQWGFEITTAEDSTFIVEVNGEETGTWSADGSISTVNTDISDLIANSSIVIDGEELPMPPGLEAPGIPETIASESAYSCDGDVLTISNESATSTFNRS